MRIFPISDIHLEFQDNPEEYLKTIEVPDCDLVVLAGDIGYLHKGHMEMAIKHFGQFANVFHIDGNHDFYDNGRLKEKSCTNFMNLHGTKIVGAPLWFEDDPNNILYEKYYADFQNIPDFKKYVYERNEYEKGFIDRSLDNNSPDVVVTHFAPCELSIASKYYGSNLNRFFYTDLSEMILEKGPKLWIHGHMHNFCDYELGNTRIVCNPIGYPHEKSQHKNMVIDV